jgi:serine/threonine protein kinase
MALPESTPIEGKYEILQKLVEGGMGAVYKVRHRLLDEIRVVKVIRPQLEASDELKERFLREARSAVRLRHPNIAELYDFTVDEGGVGFMVMEFIDGKDLRRLAKQQGRLSIALVLEATIQALRALGYLHRSGFVHRDISPDNLMVTKDVDGRPLIKLIDLGIAKPLEGDESLTLTGSFLGKFRYAAPEQFGGGGLEIDGRTDLYSLGVVLYELVTGRHPFPGETQHEVVGGHLFHPPIDFAVSDPEGRIPEALRQIVLHSLEKRADDRYDSAESFAAALREVQDSWGEEIGPDEIPTGGSPVAAVEEGSRPGSTQERLDREFALGEATPIITTLETERLPPEAAPTVALDEPEETRVAPRRVQGRTLYWVVGGALLLVAALAAVFFQGRRSVDPTHLPLTSRANDGARRGGAEPSQGDPSPADPRTEPLANPAGEVPAEPAADPRVERLLGEARGLFRQGEDRRTLDLLRQILSLDAESPEAARLQLELVESARRGAERASTLAREAQAPARAPATVRRAEEALSLAGRRAAAGELAAATSYWESADLFRDATQQAQAAISNEAQRAVTAAAEARRAAEEAARRTAELEERALAAEAAAPAAEASVVEAPAPKPAPPPVAPPVAERRAPPAPIDETPAVLAALDAYASAYEALDIEKLRRAWPSLGGAQLAAIRSSFEGAREIEVEIANCRIRMEGGAGSATCLVSQAYRPRHGARQTDERQVTFQLRKLDDRWVIESL